MPDRDFYLGGGRMAELRKQYQAYIAQMLQLAGVADPAGKAQRIGAGDEDRAGACHPGRNQ